MERPEQATEEVMDYLDDLRDSGATNMWGAGEYLQARFGLVGKGQDNVLFYWMNAKREEART